jgi:thioredoxin-like negative regulator of GroEL
VGSTIDKVAEDVDVILEKYNVLDDWQVSDKYEVSSAPTFVITKDDLVVNKMLGGLSQVQLLQWLERFKRYTSYEDEGGQVCNE